MPEITPEEYKRLRAIERANEVFDFISRIATYNGFIEVTANLYDPKIQKNVALRDCEAFWQRICELGLREAHPCLKQ